MSDTEIDNRNSPSYLSHYGMFRAPFKNTLEDDMYYAEPTRTQRLDILLHLAQYGNELLLVTGPEDSGKTTMLNQFLKRVSDNWKVCSLDAVTTTDRTRLLQHINRCFGFPDEKLPLDAALGNLKRRLEAMLSTQQTVIIVVDNAHKASTEVLDLLMDYASIRNISKGVALRILLFSEPQIKIHLASPELQARQNLPIRKVDLPPFNEQQTSRLIRHRVTTAGLVSKNVFNEAIVSKIHKYSDGWPGAITEIAHQVLFESTPLKQRDNRGKDNEGTPRKSRSGQAATILSGLIIVGALAGLVVFQDEVNKLFGAAKLSHRDADMTPAQTSRTLSLPAPPSATDADATADKDADNSDSAITAGSSTFPDTTMTGSRMGDSENFPELPDVKPPSASAPVANDLLPPPDTTSIPEAPPAKPDARQPAAAEDSILSLPNTTTVPEPKRNASQTTSDKATNIAAVTADEPVLTDDITLEHQADWVLAQNPGHFTLQLVAGYQASTINKFIRKQLLPESDLAYYYSLNKGKDWHSLLFGVYASRTQAAGAADELSKKIKTIRPWIRPLQSIQNDIRYAQSRQQPAAP